MAISDWLLADTENKLEMMLLRIRSYVANVVGGSSLRLSKQRALKRTGKIGSNGGNGKTVFCALKDYFAYQNCQQINLLAR